MIELHQALVELGVIETICSYYAFKQKMRMLDEAPIIVPNENVFTIEVTHGANQRFVIPRKRR